jgi:hypothetical protein
VGAVGGRGTLDGTTRAGIAPMGSVTTTSTWALEDIAQWDSRTGGENSAVDRVLLRNKHHAVLSFYPATSRINHAEENLREERVESISV